MKYKCINCANEWGEWKAHEDKTHFSHGLCKECVKEHLLPKIRQKQINEGNWDCFGKAEGYCDQRVCKYIEVCEKLNK